MLRYLTAGESHGPALMGILEGLPAGLTIDLPTLQAEMKRRKLGYGRGRRQQIEPDEVEIMAGIRHGLTMGEMAQFMQTTEPTLKKLKLSIIELDGWRRDLHWDALAYPWVAPSPNIPDWETALVYVGTCLFEGVNQLLQFRFELRDKLLATLTQLFFKSIRGAFRF